MSEDEHRSAEKTIERSESEGPPRDVNEDNMEATGAGSESEEDDDDLVEGIKDIREDIGRVEEKTGSSFEEFRSSIKDLHIRLDKLEQQSDMEGLVERVGELQQELESLEEEKEKASIDRKIAIRVVQAVVLIIASIFLAFNTGLTLSAITSAAPVIALILLTVEITGTLISEFHRAWR